MISRRVSLKFIVAFTTILVLVFSTIMTPFRAIAAPSENCAIVVEDRCMDQDYLNQNINHYDPTLCDADSSGGGNKDYLGKPVLTQAQLDAIKRNKPTYEDAAKAAQIPWQMIAVIHLRETNLSRINPSNGQGLFQDAAKINGPYPYSGNEVDDAEFSRQATWAANFLKAKATQPSQLVNGDKTQVKDAFFGYNGRAKVYKDQAKKLGFAEDADGSPYVMNRADAVRDPDVHKTDNTWGQIKTDGGSLVYPANSDYGAFVVYSAIKGGTSSSIECADIAGELRKKIVTLAEAELALWENGDMMPGFRGNNENSFSKYTDNIAGDWCAWFVSWILKKAGKPVGTSSQQWWSYVDDFVNKGPIEKGFKVHEKSAEYKPQIGDLAIYDGDGGTNTHINIVVGFADDGRLITIGGNQGAGRGGNFQTSKVNRNIGYGDLAARYVSVD